MNTSRPQPTGGSWRPTKKPNQSYSNQWRPPGTLPVVFPIFTAAAQQQTKPSLAQTSEQDVSEGFPLEEMDLTAEFSESSSTTSILKSARASQIHSAVQAKQPVVSGKTYMICGVKVDFPHEAYPSQIGVMEKVLRCLTGNQNGLLESPTGSGKSLALLCSSLAWQTKEYEKANAFKVAFSVVESIRKKAFEGASGQPKRSRTELGIQMIKSDANKNVIPAVVGGQKITIPSVQLPTSICSVTSACSNAEKLEVQESAQTSGETSLLPESGFELENEKSERVMSIQPASVSVAGRTFGRSKKTKSQKGVVFEEDSEEESLQVSAESSLGPSLPSTVFETQNSVPEQAQNVTDSENVERIPKIYFGSRTHKQIAQLIRELQKTCYKNLRMAILGSKDQYCVHPVVSKQRNKNEACQELLDNTVGGDDGGSNFKSVKGCEFYNGGRLAKTSFQVMRRFGLQPAYDIEDLNKVGKRHVICPFFASKDLAKKAQLIFCPYNYLVDARIRAAMEIDLDGQIVIFDEGHNMEDAAREAASFTLTTVQLRDAVDDMATVISVYQAGKSQGGAIQRQSPIHDTVMLLMQKCRALMEWMDRCGKNIMAGLQGGSREFIGDDVIVHLKEVGLGPDDYGEFLAAYDEVRDDKAVNESEDSRESRPSDDEKTKKVSGNTVNLLRGLVVVLGYIYKDSKRHLIDYRVVLIKEMNRNMAFLEDAAGYRRKRKKDEINQWTHRLNFWCLNPGVAFGDFLKAKAVVLTSGTLSPISSFQSELGVRFGVQFEANHVIGMDQVWAGGVARGPRNTQLLGNYQMNQTLAYQDDIGEAVLRICQIVPKGVLCFFTSYAVLENQLRRWQEAGFMDDLKARKVVLQEPRHSGGDKSVFENVMEEFYSAIKGESLEEGQDGAIMFAVCRGKISEGLDFADDNARAVITVGIPFPNYNDEQVKMKRTYNDGNAKRGLLSGSSWYDIQAFRALNQALGRCLRHRNDWGALILLDQRFATGASPQSKYILGLSKWLRPRIKPFTDFQVAMTSLAAFIRNRVTLAFPKIVDQNLLTEDELSSLFTDDEFPLT